MEQHELQTQLTIVIEQHELFQIQLSIAIEQHKLQTLYVLYFYVCFNDDVHTV